MDTTKCIKTRRSIRSYQDKKIDKKIIEEIIDCARFAPTGHNLQPWEFIIVTNKDNLKLLSEVCTYGKFIKNAACCIVVCGDKHNHHLIEDCSAATQNILLAANVYGIGSCWVAGWKRTYNKDIKNILKIPDDIDIVSVIPLGYPSEKPKIGKKDLKEIIHWDKF